MLLGNRRLTKRMSRKLPPKARFADRFFGLCRFDIRPFTFKAKCCGMPMRSFCKIKLRILPRSEPFTSIRSVGMACRNLVGTLPDSSGCRSLMRTKPFSETASCPGFIALKAFKAIATLPFSSVWGMRR